MRIFISSIGQDSHSFEEDSSSKALMLGGLAIEGYPGLRGNSDADVILHALCNAISGLTGRPVLGERADELCQVGVRDSTVYLRLALQDLREDPRDFKLHHLSLSLEGRRPLFEPHREAICGHIATLLELSETAVTLTATTGEDLSAFGLGKGLYCTCILSASCRDAGRDSD